MLVLLAALGLGILLSVLQPHQTLKYVGLSLMNFSAGFLFAKFETSRADSPFLKIRVQQMFKRLLNGKKSALMEVCLF